MKSIRSFLFFQAATGATLVAGVTPIQKVVQLLESMAAKGKKELHDEQVQYAAYNQFCDDTDAEKVREIAELKVAILKFDADAGKARAQASELTREVVLFFV